MKKQILITVLAGLIVTTWVWAWSEPTVAPPGGNVYAPLNTGSGGQIKTGGLILNTGGATNGLIVANGTVGIGVTSPAARLHTLSPLRVGYPGDTVNYYLQVESRVGASTVDWDFKTHDYSGGDRTMISMDSSTGNIGIGTTAPGSKLDVNGEVRALSFDYRSDKSLKKDINVLDNSLEKILSLDGVSFDWKDSGEFSIGLIAQDVEKIFPSIVSTSETTGLKSVGYAKLVAPLIEAIKEQQKEIDLLKEEISKLK
jgi:hypothetical protein